MLCQEPLGINVVSQNMLLDYTRTKAGLVSPQIERVPSLARGISAVFPKGELHIVGLQEVQVNETTHNGNLLAKQCGYEYGRWTQHNKKPHPQSPTGRPGEHIGIFGSMVDSTEVIELGDNRRALMAEIAGVAFATIHFRHGPAPRHIAARSEQARHLVGRLSEYDDAVILGDFNEPDMHIPLAHHITPARKTLKRDGYRSVFELTGQKAPDTCPTEPYLPLFRKSPDWRGTLLNRAWGLDDILIRGSRVRALSAGVVPRVIEYEGEPPHGVPLEGSDHDGIWAQLSVSIHD